MLLADIGNTRVHIYDDNENNNNNNNNKIIHLYHKEAIERYQDKKIYYITVKSQLKKSLNRLESWIDISDKIILKGSYSTMGIDRKALCLSHKTGIFISAGSAITVDIMKDGEYQGGFLLLGLTQYIKSYGLISPALKTNLNQDINIDKLPKTTKDGISYGIIASIKMLVEKHQNGKKLYISGGDGEFLSSFFDNAIFDERLIFQGIKNALRSDIC